jgi:hypothetical protein
MGTSQKVRDGKSLGTFVSSPPIAPETGCSVGKKLVSSVGKKINGLLEGKRDGISEGLRLSSPLGRGVMMLNVLGRGDDKKVG